MATVCAAVRLESQHQPLDIDLCGLSIERELRRAQKGRSHLLGLISVLRKDISETRLEEMIGVVVAVVVVAVVVVVVAVLLQVA